MSNSLLKDEMKRVAHLYPADEQINKMQTKIVGLANFFCKERPESQEEVDEKIRLVSAIIDTLLKFCEDDSIYTIIFTMTQIDTDESFTASVSGRNIWIINEYRYVVYQAILEACIKYNKCGKISVQMDTLKGDEIILQDACKIEVQSDFKKWIRIEEGSKK